MTSALLLTSTRTCWGSSIKTVPVPLGKQWMRCVGFAITSVGADEAAPVISTFTPRLGGVGGVLFLSLPLSLSVSFFLPKPHLIFFFGFFLSLVSASFFFSGATVAALSVWTVGSLNDLALGRYSTWVRVSVTIVLGAGQSRSTHKLRHVELVHGEGLQVSLRVTPFHGITNRTLDLFEGWQ